MVQYKRMDDIEDDDPFSPPQDEPDKILDEEDDIKFVDEDEPSDEEELSS